MGGANEAAYILFPHGRYLLFAWLFDKLCQAVRLSPGADASEKLLRIAQGFTEAFASLWLRHETSRPPLAKRIYSAPYGRTHNMVVDAFGVEMGTDHRLKFPAEQPVRKFHSDLMRQFRGDFSGSKTLHQMESLHAFFLMPYLFDLTHILKGRVYGTADG